MVDRRDPALRTAANVTDAKIAKCRSENKSNFISVISSSPVIPVQAGIHLSTSEAADLWIPAYAGMTAIILGNKDLLPDRF